MKAKKYLTQEEIKRLFNYDPEMGIFTWKHRSEGTFLANEHQNLTCRLWNGKHAGKRAGQNLKRYRIIKVKGGRYLESRLAYIYVHGDVLSQDDEMDHKNRDSFDGRIENLRLSTRQSNMRNCNPRKNNTCGVNGVCFHKRDNLWVASVRSGGKKIRVCHSKDFRKAVQARYDAEVKYGYTKVNPESTAYQYLQGGKQP